MVLNRTLAVCENQCKCEGRPEDLDVEKIKGLFIENGYTFDIY